MIKFIRYTKNKNGRVFIALITKYNRYDKRILGYRYLRKSEPLIFLSDNNLSVSRIYKKHKRLMNEIYPQCRLDDYYWSGDLANLEGQAIVKFKRYIESGKVIGYYSVNSYLTPAVRASIADVDMVDLSVT